MCRYYSAVTDHILFDPQLPQCEHTSWQILFNTMWALSDPVSLGTGSDSGSDDEHELCFFIAQIYLRSSVLEQHMGWWI